MENEEEKNIHNSSRTSREYKTLVELELALKKTQYHQTVNDEIVKVIDFLRSK